MSGRLAIIGVSTAGYGRLQILHDVDLDGRAGRGRVPARAERRRQDHAAADVRRAAPAAARAGARRRRAVSSRRRAASPRLGIGFVPDNRGLFLQLTVAENLRLVHPWRAPLADVPELFPALAPLMKRRAGLAVGR